MPPFAPEYYQWWMTDGYDFVIELLDQDKLPFKSSDVGYLQAIQHNLRAFDNNQVWREKQRGDLIRICRLRSIDYDENPRKLLKEAASSIFKKTEDGGIDYGFALEGLAYLDAMEVCRLRLQATVQLAVEETAEDDGNLKIIEVLHRVASKRYSKFHMGLRACVSFKLIS